MARSGRNSSKTVAWSVVVPAYNEAESLPVLMPRIVAVLEGLGRHYEIIVVDDGSTDRTGEVLKQLQGQYPTLEVIRFDRNYGQSAAFDAGFQRTKGRIIITMDADLQNAPEDIPKLLEKIPEYDMACGWRVKREDGFVKRVSSCVANFVRSRATGDGMHDTGCSLKAFKQSCLAELPRFDGMHRFFPALLKQAGFKVVEVPVRHFPRQYGRTRYGLWGRLIRPTMDLFGVMWLARRRLRYRIKDSS